MATIVVSHADPAGGEAGYSLEAFSGIKKTIAVITVRESQIEPLARKEVLLHQLTASSISNVSRCFGFDVGYSNAVRL
jgi:hypothetical protein